MQNVKVKKPMKKAEGRKKSFREKGAFFIEKGARIAKPFK